MTIATAPRRAEVSRADDGQAHDGPGRRGVPAQDRGRLVIDRQVVEKVIRQVAQEVAGAEGGPGGFLGLGGEAELRPHASVELVGRTAAVTVSVGLPYPAPIRDITERLRTRIIDRGGALTGLTIGRVDIRVAWIRATGADA